MTKEDEILLAAEEEFFRNGYDASSTATIAKRAGVTHAMVNYYFKNKELLFMQVLENNIGCIIASLKRLLESTDNIVDGIINLATAVFDTLNDRRQLPFLLCDISRTHPEFLAPYSEFIDGFFYENIEHHQACLDKNIAEKAIRDCSIKDIYRTIMTLATTPYLALHFIKNVVGFSEERTEQYLRNSRAEMIRILDTRFNIGK